MTMAAQPGQATAYKILGPSDLTNSRKALWQSLFPEHENSDYLGQWQTWENSPVTFHSIPSLYCPFNSFLQEHN